MALVHMTTNPQYIAHHGIIALHLLALNCHTAVKYPYYLRSYGSLVDFKYKSHPFLLAKVLPKG